MAESKGATHNVLNLAFGFSFADLYDRDRLKALDDVFVDFVRERDADLAERLLVARQRMQADTGADRGADESPLLLALAEPLEDFLVQLFGIESAVEAHVREHTYDVVHRCRRLFVQRRALKAYKADDVRDYDGLAEQKALAVLFGEPFSEDAYARHVMVWLDDEESQAQNLDKAARYGAWACLMAEGQRAHRQGSLFMYPHRLDMADLVPLQESSLGGVATKRAPETHQRFREGFALTDDGMDLAQALAQAHYCIYCHKQGKDSCSKGFATGEAGSFRENVFGEPLSGCPLGEKISEMNLLKGQGFVVSSLAVAVVDNPMIAGTGHRICNDCMKACIYQKQQPVDIPQVETRVLKDVLALPWGFEIYSLLTRWNPLNLERPYPRALSGHKVLVVGLGPAGYTLAHHLMNDGHSVVGIDGLKLEPLSAWNGVDLQGEPTAFEPIYDVESLYEPLESRIGAGFGGVAEYGITVRWNKNFLRLIRLLIERRATGAFFGGVRFGSTITLDEAWQLGFDHVALCMGAGKPTIIDMPNGLVAGVRQASDFLMSLQLTGAAKDDSVSNLQLRLPVVVIGGGLTAVDTATEALAYYPQQVERFLVRYERLESVMGAEVVARLWDERERAIVAEYVAHARALRAERKAAAEAGRAPNIKGLLDEWGGVLMVYRKDLAQSPSYRLNYEEVCKAVEEGIHVLDNHAPQGVVVDTWGEACALDVVNGAGTKRLKAGSILVAAGTKPNVVLSREADSIFSLDKGYFQAVDEAGNAVEPQRLPKPKDVHVLTHVREDGRGVSFFGDLHPSYAGNVVRAMASAKQGYPQITRLLETRRGQDKVGSAFEDFQGLRSRLNGLWRAYVVRVEELAPRIVELIVHAQAAARHFEPGQFFRFQNYESLAPLKENTRLAMEGLALTGAWVDKDKGLLSLIVLEMGGSSDICRVMRPDEPVVLMGPTGMPTELVGGENVLLVGGGLGNAVLFSIAAGLRAKGSKVLYFAGYRKMHDRYKVSFIEQASDHVVWCCDEGPGFSPARACDFSFVGNIVEAMVAYGEGRLEGQAGQKTMGLGDIDRLIVIGSDGMMGAVAAARHGVLKPYLKPKHIAIGSINSPMQCMMKEICAQCLQVHRDPQTGETSVVYSCFNQDQPLDRVDFKCLRERLAQNSVHEKLTSLWLQHCLSG
ncbi:MAG: FAD-dependent oxidoreductase [Alphaproteobacteria bacterium GM202ARS2]|nr:FAD-dependent oxidoreductase [Alphaproteobacteria bacterium GM202ARS2]